jgi:kynurenine 3-monooxygenase
MGTKGIIKFNKVAKPLTELIHFKNKVTIAGSGPVGAMLAIILSRENYLVDVFESRPDPRAHNAQQGRSINITLSERAWAALEIIGLDKKVRQYATPLYKRVFHSKNGSLSEQSYGNKNQAIWSISREKLTEVLISQAEQEAQVNLHFEQRLTHIDFSTACTSFSYLKAGRKGHKEVDADYVFAADGAFSKVRRLAQETPRFSYSQRYMEQSYIELTIAANEDGSTKLSPHASHMWPRKDFLLVALPNNDGSFTCTLYLNYQGETSFSSLTTPKAVTDFFLQNFTDVMPLLENPIAEFLNKTPSPLFLVSADPWVINTKVALVGDAAHAMLPFYGHGLNSSFEDCHVIAELIKLYNHDWIKILPAYYSQRKANTHAISKLSNDYFFDISHFDNDESLSKKIADKFALKYPKLWPSIDQMISLSRDISYEKARKISLEQKSIMTEIMKINDIQLCWQKEYVYQKLEKMALIRLLPLLK